MKSETIATYKRKSIFVGHLVENFLQKNPPKQSALNCEPMADGYSAGLQAFPGRKSFIMYHGTTMAIAQEIKRNGFIQSADGMLGPGVYMSRSLEKASRYPIDPKGQQLAVLKLSVRVGKVKKIDYQGHPYQKSWHQKGYDTAWVPPNCGMVPSGLEEDCVYDPQRIKVLQIYENRR